MSGLMRVLCLMLAVLLCASCTARRQDGAGGQESSSSQGLIQAGAGAEGGREESAATWTDPKKEGEASSTGVPADLSGKDGAASSQKEGVPASDVPPVPAPAEQSGGDGASQGTVPASARSISSFDFASSRIEPTCYLPERDNFLSMSYHDFSALYLAGFSPDGKMAFFKEVELDGKGGTDLYFIVQDLVSDEVLWELKSPDDESYGYEEGLHKRFVADYGSQIDKKLFEYGIVISPCEYRSMPYSADGLSLSASIESQATGKMMYDMFELTSYSCIVTDGRGHSKKVIAGREFMGPEAFVCGCIKNPYEDRLALVIAEATYGFEGCDLLVRIAGCDLRKGF